MIQYL